MSDVELRELHVMYWALNREDSETFPDRNFEEFSVFLHGLENQNRICFTSSLRYHYGKLVEKEVSKGVKVLEEYLQPELPEDE